MTAVYRNSLYANTYYFKTCLCRMAFTYVSGLKCVPYKRMTAITARNTEHHTQYVQQIAANLPPEIGRHLANACTVRFGTKELSSNFLELWSVHGHCLLISTGKFPAISCMCLSLLRLKGHDHILQDCRAELR